MGARPGTGTISRRRAALLYMGSQSSPVRMRLYEKGLQPEYAHLNRPNWARIEVQVRPAKEAKETFASLSPLEVWGASRWTRDIAAKVLEQHIDPHPAGTTYRLTEREAALRWMCKQYGQHLASLAQDLGGWECVGLTLNEIMTAQAKGRQSARKGALPRGEWRATTRPSPTLGGLFHGWPFHCFDLLRLRRLQLRLERCHLQPVRLLLQRPALPAARPPRPAMPRSAARVRPSFQLGEP